MSVKFGESGCKPVISTEAVYITSDIKEDPEVAQVVSEYMHQMGDQMEQVVGHTVCSCTNAPYVLLTRINVQYLDMLQK